MKTKIFIFSLILFTSLLYGQAQTKTSQFEDVPISGNEKWTISQKTFNIEGTSIVGRTLFVIKVLIDDQPSEKYMDDAKEIAKYAIKTDRYIKAGLVSINDELISLNESIGVALIKNESTDSSAATGYRFHFFVSDLANEMNIHTPSNDYITIELPAFLKNYLAYYNSGNFDELYSTFSSEYQSQISLEKFKTAMNLTKSKFSSIKNINFLFPLYLGSRGGVDGYNIYLHTDLESTNLTFKEAYLKLLILYDGSVYKYFGSEWMLSR
jgi:hypothetical protein